MYQIDERWPTEHTDSRLANEGFVLRPLLKYRDARVLERPKSLY